MPVIRMVEASRVKTGDVILLGVFPPTPWGASVYGVVYFSTITSWLKTGPSFREGPMRWGGSLLHEARLTFWARTLVVRDFNLPRTKDFCEIDEKVPVLNGALPRSRREFVEVGRAVYPQMEEDLIQAARQCKSCSS